MKPVMFCRKTSGTRRLQQSSMKCAPFCADSAKRTPLFARIPTGIALDAREAGDERLAVERLELVEARAVDDARDQLARVGLLAEVLGDQPVELGRVERRRLRLGDVPGRLGLRRWRLRTMPRASASACSSEVA